MPFYAIEDLVPVVSPSAFIHPTAVLIGDVIIGPHCYVGPHASLRGDFGGIILEEGSNVQDCCVMHSFPGKDCVVEPDGHIGHGAILHGCRIGQNALVGMNAVIMDDAEIGAESLVGATAFVRSEFQCPPRSMVVGNPAEVRRSLSDREITWKSAGTSEYRQLTQRCLDSHREIEPLKKPQKNRPRFQESKYETKDAY